MSDGFTKDLITKAMKTLSENDAEPFDKLICYEWEADDLIKAGLKTEDQIYRIPTKLPKYDGRKPE